MIAVTLSEYYLLEFFGLLWYNGFNRVVNCSINRELMKECDCMKKVWTYFAIGCVVAIIGMFFSDICGDFFNGMDYGSACVLAHYG